MFSSGIFHESIPTIPIIATIMHSLLRQEHQAPIEQSSYREKCPRAFFVDSCHGNNEITCTQSHLHMHYSWLRSEEVILKKTD